MMVMHFVSNLLGSADHALFAGEQYTQCCMLFVAMALLIALGVLRESGLKLGQRETRESPPRQARKPRSSKINRENGWLRDEVTPQPPKTGAFADRIITKSVWNGTSKRRIRNTISLNEY